MSELEVKLFTKLAECRSRLKEAEEVLIFYADKESWTIGMHKDAIDPKDFDGEHGGKKAREYFEKWEGEK